MKNSLQLYVLCKRHCIKVLMPLLLLCSLNTFAQTRLPAVISANMVLQRNMQVPVWGWSAPGLRVEVKFGNQLLTATAGADSLWLVKLTPLAASNTPQVMTITAGNERFVLNNILVGEVWLCSGQSNMEYPIDKSEFKFANPGKGIDSAALELHAFKQGIRILKIDTKFSYPEATTRGWQDANGKDYPRSSVVAYYFARQLQARLKIPVGVITAAWGGSRIEPWTPPAAYTTLPAFTEDVKKSDTLMDRETEGKMYRSLIRPLVPFAIKGVIWYQGESNCLNEEHDMRYAYKMQAMIEYWRKQWGANLPFYYVLVAPYMYTDWTNMPHTPETLPAFWEQQVAAAKIPNTGFIVITDLVDNLKDIHPSYKWEVGRRLANVALAKTYNQKKVDYLYPQYDHLQLKKNQLVLYFKNTTGLKTTDGKAPDFFTVAGADGNFLPAIASIKGQTIVLTNPAIKNPVNARFGWVQTATPNLVNATGLPAVPFRTNGDAWIYKPGK